MKNRLRAYFASLKFHRPALIESGKILFALVGVGTVLGNLAVMRFWQFPVGLAIVGVVWFALYSQMEGVQG